MDDIVERHTPPWECEYHGEGCLLDDHGKLFCGYCQDFAVKDAEIERLRAIDETRLRELVVLQRQLHNSIRLQRGHGKTADKLEKAEAVIDIISKEHPPTSSWCVICNAIREYNKDKTEDACIHEWVDARNTAVTSGELCLKCFAIRAGNTQHDKDKTDG